MAGPQAPVLASTQQPAVRRAAAPRWVQAATLLLSLGGLGVSLYLTVAHYTTSMTLACPDTGVVNCEKVTTSPESVVFGIFPVAVLGLAFYVVMVAVNSPWAWRARSPVIGWLRLGSLIAGVGFVLYLVYTELFTLDAIYGAPASTSSPSCCSPSPSRSPSRPASTPSAADRPIPGPVCAAPLPGGATASGRTSSNTEP
jgi:uncharacterized membrane protein